MSHTGISAAARGLPDIWLRTIIVLRSRPDFSAAGCLWPPFGRNDSENQSFLCVLRGKMKIRHRFTQIHTDSHRFTQIKQDKKGKDKSVKSVQSVVNKQCKSVSNDLLGVLLRLGSGRRPCPLWQIKYPVDSWPCFLGVLVPSRPI